MLFPASDESTVAVSRHKRRLEEHYVVACPEWEIVETFIDKAKTHALAEAHGVPAPRTITRHSAPDLADCARLLGFPMLVKPAQSHLFFDRFKRKMVRVGSLPELASVYRAVSEAGLEVMLQEIIPGDDSSVVNYNSYFWNGQALVEFTARQIRKAPPEFGSPRVAVSARIPEVIEPGRDILRSMGFYGFACTEFKRDRRDGVYKLMEVNGRHNLSGLLAVRCGVNFPLIHYRHLVERRASSGWCLPVQRLLDRHRSATWGIAWATSAQSNTASRSIWHHTPGATATPSWTRKDLGPFRTRLATWCDNPGRA